ncbi:hypothetical protein D3C86_1876420 [compost metagenome]
MHGQSGLCILWQLRLCQPRSRAFDAHRFTGQQIGNETLARLQIAQGIAARRVEQAGAETQLAAGGDRGGYLKRSADFPGHDIHTAKTTQQGNHGAAVFGHRQYCWLGALLQQ